MALTSPPTAVAPFDKGRLAAGITASATSLTVSPIYKTVNGVRTKQGINTTSGCAIISAGDFTELVTYTGASVDATTKITTISGLTRGRDPTQTTASNSFAGGTGRVWAKGAKFTVVADATYFQSGVFTNVANTFTANQTLSSTNELRFADSATAIWDDGTSLSFKDSTTATKTLAQLSAAAGTDEKAKVSIDDTTGDYLLNKLTAGAGVTLTETNPAGDEEITIAAVNTVATGHTGLSTITTGGLLVGAGTSNMTIIGPGTNGQVPMSNGTTIAMAQAVPIGTLAMWGTDTAPTNWLLCYGQAVSRSTYSALFAVVSTAFGVGDGSTTFNLPDMRGRFPLGQDDMGGSSANRVTATEADTVGSAAGTADGAHTHSIATAGANPGGGATSVVTNVTGSTSTMPPYLTVNYIIYAAA